MSVAADCEVWRSRVRVQSDRSLLCVCLKRVISVIVGVSERGYAG